MIYIGSGLEAIYEETGMKPLREYLASLFAPILAAKRSYQMDYAPGVMPHLMTSRDTLVLHLLADTGNKNKHLRTREEFLPVADVKVRIRATRGVRSVSLLRSGERLSATPREGWLDLTVPRVLIHEAVRVDFAA